MPTTTPFPVEDELKAVEKLLHDKLHSCAPLTDQVARHIICAGGKRLRPTLTLLTAGCAGKISESHLRLAAAVEFLHTATLLHDDVVDEALERRGRPSANHQWGAKESVLVGDFLYSRALQVLVQISDLEVLRCMTEASNRLVEGEVMQLSRIGDLKLTETEYFTIITAKTAVLLQAAAYCSALLCGASTQIRDSLAEFGMQLGLAFQLRDDILDYTGENAVTGKKSGQDLREKKLTLPLIAALRMAETQDRHSLLEAAQQPYSADVLQIARGILQRSGALEYAREQAEQCRRRAEAALHNLPNSAYRICLGSLAALSVERDT